MMTLTDKQLRGSYPPLLTAFKEDGGIDYGAYEKLVAAQIDGGSHGLVVNGTSAEPSVLTVAERKQILEAVLAATRKRVPVIAATGSQSHAETVELSEHAAHAGADALLIVTPYYIRPPQRGLVAYYNDLGRRTGLPMLMYHIPGRASVSVTIETLEEIATATPTFVGIKHASPDLTLVTEALARFGPDFRIFVGLEELSFPMLALGACGMINAVSNIAPRWISSLYEAVSSGDLTSARQLHYQLFDLNRAVFFDTNPIPLKYMAKRLGLLPDNRHRLPMMPATADVAAKLDRVLRDAGLLPPTVEAHRGHAGAGH